MSKPDSRAGRTFDIVYSLGFNCACAQHLRKLGLRSTSGPFDWLTCVPFPPRAELILNHFNGFLEPEDFYAVPEDPDCAPREKCDPYQNRRTGFLHLHDFPAGVPIEQSFPAAQEKYRRRIERFERNLSDPAKRILLVWFFNEPMADEALLVDLCRRIVEKYGAHLRFLFIESSPHATPGKPQRQCPTEYIERYSYYVNPAWPLRKQHEPLSRILKRYRTPGVAGRRARMRVNRSVVAVIPALIPVKKWRTACREKLKRIMKTKGF